MSKQPESICTIISMVVAARGDGSKSTNFPDNPMLVMAQYYYKKNWGCMIPPFSRARTFCKIM